MKKPSEARSIVNKAKTDILAKEWEHTVHQTNSHPSLAIVSATDEIASSWNAIWDEALEYGIRGTKLMQHLFFALSKPVLGIELVPTAKMASQCGSHTPSISCHNI